MNRDIFKTVFFFLPSFFINFSFTCNFGIYFVEIQAFFVVIYSFILFGSSANIFKTNVILKS